MIMSDRFQSFIDFLNWLEDEGIPYQISKDRKHALMATIRVVGLFIEVEIVDDHFEISYFRGDEAVEDDLDKLKSILLKRTA